jgi:L-serine dehydratase
MTVSVFDLFKIGIGPSSSHTVGPMRAAFMFATSLDERALLGSVAAVRAELFGSLGATGHGHGSVKAVVLGLSGEQPESVDPAAAEPVVAGIRTAGTLRLLGRVPVPFDVDEDVILPRRKRLEFHSNAMRFAALDDSGAELSGRTYYSVGGGFVLGEDAAGRPAIVADPTPVPYPFSSGAELLAITHRVGLPVSGVMLANELVRRDKADVESGLLRIWAVMQECVRNGCAAEGCCRAASKSGAGPGRSSRSWSRAATRPIPCTRWSGSRSTRSRSTRKTRRAAAW